MPSNPVSPDEFKAILPASNSSLCAKLLAGLVKFPTLFYQWFSWAFNADGTPSDDFKQAIGLTTGTLSAPTNVHASDGTFTDHVVVTWDSVAGATSYEVWRGPNSDNASASLLGSTVAGTLTFTDATVTADTRYYYFLKARSATDSSGFSAPDFGFADSTGGGGGGGTGELGVPQSFPGDGTWKAPAGSVTADIELWGAGGSGGNSVVTWCPTDSYLRGGGGGGSGEYLKITGMTVTAGKTYNVRVGHGGTSGASGGPTALVDPTDPLHPLCESFGGGGGSVGTCSPSSGAGGAGGSGGTHAGGGAVDPASANGATGDTGLYGYSTPYPGSPMTGGPGGTAVGGHGAGGKGADGGVGGTGAPGSAGYMIITPN